MDNNDDTGFVCPNCGNSEFHAHQVCYHDVIVDGHGNFLEDGDVYESDRPYGTFTCTKCGKEFEELG